MEMREWIALSVLVLGAVVVALVSVREDLRVLLPIVLIVGAKIHRAFRAPYAPRALHAMCH
jgi:hypothetical protein